MNISKWLDYLYPPRCPVCDQISAQGICTECRRKIQFIEKNYCMKCGKPLENSQGEYCRDCRTKRHVFVRNRALVSYRGPVKLSLYQMKYGNRREYAVTYGREMAKALGPWIKYIGITRIVPVPLHPARKRRRGYNQAEYIARAIGKELQLPVDTRILYRIRNTKPQKKLNDQQRRQNLSRAFEVRKRVEQRECILLIDDIYTTGSTLDAAADCLQRATGCQVYAAAIAIGG